MDRPTLTTARFFWAVRGRGPEDNVCGSVILRDAFIGLPVTAGNPNAADALALDDDRTTAFHRRPAFRASRERETKRVRRVERLRLRAVRRGWPLVGSGADGLGSGGMHGVKTSAIHALEQDQMSARVGNGDRNCNSGFFGLIDCSRHHLLGAFGRQVLAILSVHCVSHARRIIVTCDCPGKKKGDEAAGEFSLQEIRAGPKMPFHFTNRLARTNLLNCCEGTGLRNATESNCKTEARRIPEIANH
jgi:hypothetical protein